MTTEHPTGGAQPRYEARLRGGRFRVHDHTTGRDVATCPRRSQADALALGLNEGSLLVDEHGRIITARPEAAAL